MKPTRDALRIHICECGMSHTLDEEKHRKVSDAELADMGLVQVWVDCPTCGGRGHDGHLDPNGEPNPRLCPDCNGSGKVLAEGVFRETWHSAHWEGHCDTACVTRLVLPDPTQEA